VKTDAKTETGWEVSATATDRVIEIELERLTDRTTRMRVVADKGEILFKDTATATEIILQTAQDLQGGFHITERDSGGNRKRRASE